MASKLELLSSAAPVAEQPPVRMDRRTAAEWVTRLFFPVSYRTIEAWPLTWRHVNGKAVCETRELFALAQSKIDAATPIRGGKRQMREAA